MTVAGLSVGGESISLPSIMISSRLIQLWCPSPDQIQAVIAGSP